MGESVKALTVPLNLLHQSQDQVQLTIDPNIEPKSRLLLMTKGSIMYTARGLQLNYSDDFRDWDSMPNIEDLGPGEMIVESFSNGVLQLTEPLLVVGGGLLSKQGLGVTILAEMIDSGKIYWLECPSAPGDTRLRTPMNLTPTELEAMDTLLEAQQFLHRAYYQMPNAFYVHSDQGPHQLTSWLSRFGLYDRYEQSLAGAAGLTSTAKGIPIKILHDHIDRKAWLLDGESDETTGCQHLLTIGRHIHFGALADFLNKHKICHEEPESSSPILGCQKRYFEVATDSVADLSIDSPAKLNAVFREIHMSQPKARMTYGDLRNDSAELHRLSRVIKVVEATSTDNQRKELPALAELAKKSMAKLSQGAFHLGVDLSKKYTPDEHVTDYYLPCATEEGKRTQEALEAGPLRFVKPANPPTREESTD